MRSPQLVDSGNQPGRAGTVRVILAAKVCPQQFLLGTHAPHQRRNQKRHEQHTDSGTKSKNPTQRSDKHSQIAGIADDAVNLVGSQRMSRLGCDQATKPAAEDKDGP